MPRRSSLRGFTIIELLVVIAIISLLIGIIGPTLSAARRHAERATCAAHLREVGLALRSYLDGNEEKLPYASFMPSVGPFPLPLKGESIYIAKVLSPDTGGQSQIFQCPSDKPDNTRDEPNRNKSYYQTEMSSYEFQWRLGGETLEEFVKEVEGRHGRRLQLTSIWLFRDYNNFHGPGGTPGARRYLYIDGHVTDYEY
jgi:prepilin-type N-terminal cleavage/methylation domain-containing protein